MIRVNRQTDYAIRIILALAKRPVGAQAPTAEIRAEMLIPPILIRRIVADLAQGGFILTRPGRTGGIALARPAGEITVLEVVEYFEGPIHISECMGDTFDCPFGTDCPVRRHWGRLDTLIRRELAGITFEALADEAASRPGTIPSGGGQVQA